MTMTFHISEALLIERALFVTAMILIFGFMSIGGLYLLRRWLLPARSLTPSLQEASAGLDQFGPAATQVEAIARLLVRLRGSNPKNSGRKHRRNRRSRARLRNDLRAG